MAMDATDYKTLQLYKKYSKYSQLKPIPNAPFCVQ